MNAGRRGPIKEDASDTNTKQIAALVRQSAAGRRREDGPPRRRAVARAIAKISPPSSARRATRSQREASPFTQFALTGCALLLVGLGLFQIFGTMVTVKARDETKKPVTLVWRVASRWHASCVGRAGDDRDG